jgi:2-dehydropantoate 2-reductase
MKIAIMGAGGLGGYLGAQLARAGREVTFIARGEHLRSMQTTGLQLHSRDRDFLVSPVQATADPATVGPVDLVLFCVKQYDAERAAEQIKPLLGSQTAVLPVLNGIDHIERLSGILGAEHVLGGVAVISARLTGPGVIQHDAGNSLTFGEISGEMSARCQAIHDELAVSGIQVTLAPDIVAAMWLKLIGQSAGAVCSVVRGGSFLVRSAPETIQLMRQAAAEALAVARARSAAVDPMNVEKFITSFLTFPVDIRLAMLVDLEHGRRIEVEWMTGIITRYGKALGLPTPANDFIYACLKPWANGPPFNQQSTIKDQQ